MTSPHLKAILFSLGTLALGLGVTALLVRIAAHMDGTLGDPSGRRMTEVGVAIALFVTLVLAALVVVLTDLTVLDRLTGRAVNPLQWSILAAKWFLLIGIGLLASRPYDILVHDFHRGWGILYAPGVTILIYLAFSGAALAFCAFCITLLRGRGVRPLPVILGGVALVVTVPTLILVALH